jgi:hypothetical protein
MKATIIKYMLRGKIKRITRIEISTNRPSKRHKDALKHYKAGHSNG